MVFAQVVLLVLEHVCPVEPGMAVTTVNFVRHHICMVLAANSTVLIYVWKEELVLMDPSEVVNAQTVSEIMEVINVTHVHLDSLEKHASFNVRRVASCMASVIRDLLDLVV